ncbi:MAG: aldo/keto reductase [Anaerolineae bacterium]|nr:aldo/keto reductase [Anaerolineae bacterium]
MQYRRFGKLDWKVSALGFGCMRLPTTDPNDRSRIDEELATKMVRYAIDHGVNYIDTAYPYHNGESERFVGRVLQDGYREKVRLATKLPIWKLESADDPEAVLNEQLEKLQTDYVDFYLLHGLGQKRWETVEKLNVLAWAEKALTDGRIHHLGFSFHDNFDAFKKIIDATDLWTFCQIQYNYIDVKNQAGTRGLRYAASKGLAVVIMEPILGGRIADPPDPVQALWDSAPIKRTPASWALNWLWDQPEVSVVLSGMSTMQHVTENVESASRSEIAKLTAEELAVVEQVRAKYQELCPIPCTRCEYCLPCTVNLNIPRLFAMLNEGVMYNRLGDAVKHYQRMSAEEQASACIACQQCEDKCPQRIPISEWMVHIHEILGEGKALEACLLPV